jgi:hypothetical protein
MEEAVRSAEQEHARIKRAMRRAERLMGIEGRFQVSVLFDPGFDGDGYVDVDGSVSVYRTACVTVAQWDYARATMRWFPRMTQGISDTDVLAIAVHEYVHILLNPVDRHLKAKNKHTRDNECATENLTRAILAAAEIDFPEFPES